MKDDLFLCYVFTKNNKMSYVKNTKSKTTQTSFSGKSKRQLVLKNT